MTVLVLTNDTTEDIKQQRQDLIISCVERGLAVLGITGRAAAMYMLQKRHGISRGQLADMTVLINGLREIFGLGSAVLLKAIRDELNSVHPNSEMLKVSIAEAAREIEEGI